MNDAIVCHHIGERNRRFVDIKRAVGERQGDLLAVSHRHLVVGRLCHCNGGVCEYFRIADHVVQQNVS